MSSSEFSLVNVIGLCYLSLADARHAITLLLV